MLASGMFRRTLIAALLATSPAFAQPVAVPDCTVDAVLSESEGLKLDVTYRCRASQPLSFQPTEDRAAQHVSDLKVEQGDGVVEAHYRFDLSGFARAVEFDVGRRPARQQRAGDPGQLAARAARLRSRADDRHPHDQRSRPGLRHRPAQGRRRLATDRHLRALRRLHRARPPGLPRAGGARAGFVASRPTQDGCRSPGGDPRRRQRGAAAPICSTGWSAPPRPKPTTGRASRPRRRCSGSCRSPTSAAWATAAPSRAAAPR